MTHEYHSSAEEESCKPMTTEEQEKPGPLRELVNGRWEAVAQHTPGPWWNVGTGVLAGDKNDPEVIASTEPNDIMSVQDSEQQEANARLIAAAPDLLAALKAITGIGNPPAGQPGHVDLLQAYNMAQAAIAKASGTSAAVSPSSARKSEGQAQ